MHEHRKIPPDFPFEALVRRAHAERSRFIGEVLGSALVDGYRALVRLVSRVRFHAAAAPDEAQLAGARSYAELKQRFHLVWTRRSQRALDPGR